MQDEGEIVFSIVIKNRRISLNNLIKKVKTLLIKGKLKRKLKIKIIIIVIISNFEKQRRKASILDEIFRISLSLTIIITK